MNRHATALGLLLASAMLPATGWAAPATPEEARRLTELLQRYTGQGGAAAGQPGPVSVVPQGEGYQATVDLTRLLAVLAQAGVNVTAGDLVGILLPQPDGRWKVTVDGLPPLGIVQGPQSSAMAIKDYKFEGLFDPGIQAFASSQSTNSGSTNHAAGPNGPLDTTLTDASRTTTAATAAGPRRVDATNTLTMSDIAYAVVAGAAAPAGASGDASAPVPAFRLRAAAVEGATSWKGQPSAALLELWQFLVAHPSKPELVAAQAELKTRLKALLPLGTAFRAESQAKAVAVDTALGGFGVERAALSLDLPDVAGPATTHVTIDGLALPAGLAPTWAAPLVPTAISLNNSQDVPTLTQALTYAIDNLDLSREKPLTSEQGEAVVALLQGDSTVVTITPSAITTPTLALKLAGTLRLAKPLPTGHVTISATGLDKALAAVRAGAGEDETAAQAMALMMAAKAVAKAQGPDSYLWDVDASTERGITVNGNPLGGGPAGTPQPKAHKKSAKP